MPATQCFVPVCELIRYDHLQLMSLIVDCAACFVLVSLRVYVFVLSMNAPCCCGLCRVPNDG